MVKKTFVGLICFIGIIVVVFTPHSSQLSTAPRIIGLAEEKVKLTPDEFQRLIYSSYVLTVFDAKPELEGSLLALLELQKNGGASTSSTVTPVRWALAEYRKEASSHIQPVTWRDEVLGRYFLKLCEAPGLADPPTVALNLLKVLLAQEDAAGLSGPEAWRFHAGGQRLLAVAYGPGKRQDLVECCTRRAQSDASFAMAIDALLRAEIGIALDAPPREILAANPALAQSPTMQELIHLSSSSEDGSVVITMDKLKGLFAAERAVVSEAATTHQALQREIARAQEDLKRYPDNATRVAAIIQRHAEEQANQTKRIVAASAAARTLSNMSISENKLAKKLDAASKIFSLFGNAYTQLGGSATNPAGAVGGVFSLVSLVLQCESMDAAQGESPDETILDSIKLVGEMISDLEYRFDRVDRTLVRVLEDLRRAVLLIGDVQHDVNEVRRDLLEAQTSLHRLERELHSYLNAGFRRNLVQQINGGLGFEARTGKRMSLRQYGAIEGPENTFYSWAVSHAGDELSSHWPSDDDLKETNLPSQLESRPLESNLNYINKFLKQRLRVSSLPDGPVASPRDWYVGANAYLRLAVENPDHFRSINLQRLDDVIRAGTKLEDFFRAITFVKSGPGAQVNRELYNAVLSYYKNKLDAFHAAVSKVEAAFGRDTGIDVSMWRQWEARTPRFTVAETAVNGAEGYIRRIPLDVVGVAAGVEHSLAIRANGTVVACGANGAGQCNVPPGLSDVVAVSAGVGHSLALKKDGTIVAWGNNKYGQCDIPAHEAITKICAAPNHSLALRADGRVIAWGYNDRGACNVPKDLTGVIDIAAAGCPQRDTTEISLALKKDGTIVAWGEEKPEAAKIRAFPVPKGLSKVVAIAAGYGRATAVKDDGSVIGWKVSNYSTQLDAKAIDGVTGVDAVALGEHFTLALKKDGTVEVIDGFIEGTPKTGSFVAIAAGRQHALALRRDGTVVVWGDRNSATCGLGNGTQIVTGMGRGESSREYIMADGRVTSLYSRPPLPPDIGSVVEVAVGGGHRLVLTTNGTVVEWGDSRAHQNEVPEGLSGVVAIATGKERQGDERHGHCLVLRRDGTVAAWGDNSSYQCNVPRDLDNAVAIAAGWRHSLALRANGKVEIWGDRYNYGHRNVPGGLENLDNVVAIASEYNHNLALRADGTVVAWGGSNDYGELNVPKGLTDVIAIAAGRDRSLALKADGTVVAWGRNDGGQCDFAAAQTGVVAMTSRDLYSRDSFLLSLATPGVENAEPILMTRDAVVVDRLRALCKHVVDEFDLDMNDSLNQLTGAKVLLESVLALGLPDSLDQDAFLRGFLLGSESVIDREGARALYEAEQDRLEKAWRLRASTLEKGPKDRLESFCRQLYERLDALEQSGTPEIPRMVGHTLLQLRLLRAAHP